MHLLILLSERMKLEHLMQLAELFGILLNKKGVCQNAEYYF